MFKHDDNQDATICTNLTELTFEEIEAVSGGLAGDDVPHGLGCGCRDCREYEPDRII
ncbi:hypothetical protein [Pleionea litopenaei]|uniref:Uncharacterized protein n=1 Tax=Pleionea litopenaei TaxID=3070815 RepID=A0AA51RR22_9GAMM|nr:hypothetical protein [Pleionea sp. HL-JVS1]WMS86046.1 hypothetical protein Q9312_12540 [Pleionea sp. HL-JVS1]